ncbi:DUF7144 family membrane protein [Actinoplanes sp. NPDC049316]|uniref:DUF7144 family membrane protein n=1 Tax=Actinoplanes sp. NPDC049316 TaxID=3154727 RepID=UPI00343FB133
MADQRGMPAGIQMSDATGWVASVLAGAALLVLAGALHAMTGIAALARPEIVEEDRVRVLLGADLTTVGWVHLVFGLLEVAAGVALLTGRLWARVMAIALASISTLANFLLVTVNPVWAVAVMSINLLVIYAVARHGSELEVERGT